MKDDDPERSALREMISTAVEKCTDTAILDLVHKLLLMPCENEDDNL